MTARPDSDVTDDAILGGRLNLLQLSRGHRAGTDALLAAAMIPAEPGQLIVDFGAGVGTAGLAVLARLTEVRAVLVEIDAGLAGLARQNAERNAFGGRVLVTAEDVAGIGREGSAVAADSADHVLSNPPFNAEGGRLPPDGRTARARVAPEGMLEGWMRASARVLRPGGTLSLVHRPEALPSLLAALAGRFGGVALRFVHPVEGRPAIRVLVQAVKGSRAPLRVLAPLCLNAAEGGFTAEAEAIHRNAAAIEM